MSDLLFLFGVTFAIMDLGMLTLNVLAFGAMGERAALGAMHMKATHKITEWCGRDEQQKRASAIAHVLSHLVLVAVRMFALSIIVRSALR